LKRPQQKKPARVCHVSRADLRRRGSVKQTNPDLTARRIKLRPKEKLITNRKRKIAPFTALMAFVSFSGGG
jgi:hypothetical protein